MTQITLTTDTENKKLRCDVHGATNSEELIHMMVYGTADVIAAATRTASHQDNVELAKEISNYLYDIMLETLDGKMPQICQS